MQQQELHPPTEVLEKLALAPVDSPGASPPSAPISARPSLQSPFDFAPAAGGGSASGWRTGGWNSDGHQQGITPVATSSWTALCTSLSELQRTCPSHLQPRESVCLELPLTSEQLQLDSGVMLGQGAWGDVRLCTWQGKDAAIKFINWNGDQDELESLQKELVVMSRLKHPNIVTMLAGNVRPDPQVFLVQELMACSVSDMVYGKGEHAGRKLTVIEALKIAHDVVKGLSYLHAQNVIHRDIKPDNTLLTWDGVAKIGDFGLARFKINTVLHTRTLDMGTAAYMAPEIFDPTLGGVTVAVDIYSFGIMLWELLMGERPHKNNKKPQAIFWQVLQVKLRPHLPEPSEAFPPQAMLLVLKCWSQNPKDRPTVEEVDRELGAMIEEGATFDPQSPLIAQVKEQIQLYNLQPAHPQQQQQP